MATVRVSVVVNLSLVNLSLVKELSIGVANVVVSQRS